MLKTKSQMIMRIAQLSEENTLLREQLYNKSETEQALQSAFEGIKKLNEELTVQKEISKGYCNAIEQTENIYKRKLKNIKRITEGFDYWSGSLQSASNVINEIIDITNEVL